jgi:hypothetical protein
MPEKVTKTKGGKYRVSTPGGTTAKGTTKEKAEAQVRLLRGVEHGWRPTGAKAKMRKAVTGK